MAVETKQAMTMFDLFEFRLKWKTYWGSLEQKTFWRKVIENNCTLARPTNYRLKQLNTVSIFKEPGEQRNQKSVV